MYHRIIRSLSSFSPSPSPSSFPHTQSQSLISSNLSVSSFAPSVYCALSSSFHSRAATHTRNALSTPVSLSLSLSSPSLLFQASPLPFPFPFRSFTTDKYSRYDTEVPMGRRGKESELFIKQKRQKENNLIRDHFPQRILQKSRKGKSDVEGDHEEDNDENDNDNRNDIDNEENGQDDDDDMDENDDEGDTENMNRMDSERDFPNENENDEDTEDADDGDNEGLSTQKINNLRKRKPDSENDGEDIENAEGEDPNVFSSRFPPKKTSSIPNMKGRPLPTDSDVERLPKSVRQKLLMKAKKLEKRKIETENQENIAKQLEREKEKREVSVQKGLKEQPTTTQQGKQQIFKPKEKEESQSPMSSPSTKKNKLAKKTSKDSWKTANSDENKMEKESNTWPILPLNHSIPFSVSTLTVVDENGKRMEGMSRKDAIKYAESLSLDLLLVTSPLSNLHVGKIIPYIQYKQQMEKKEQVAIKLAKAQRLPEKTMRFGPNIGEGELKSKIHQAKQWAEKGTIITLLCFTKPSAPGDKEKINSLFTKIVDSLQENQYVTETDLTRNHKLQIIVRPSPKREKEIVKNRLQGVKEKIQNKKNSNEEKKEIQNKKKEKIQKEKEQKEKEENDEENDKEEQHEDEEDENEEDDENDENDDENENDEEAEGAGEPEKSANSPVPPVPIIPRHSPTSLLHRSSPSPSPPPTQK